MPSYRFQKRNGEEAWQDVGEQEIGRETTAKEAFAWLRRSEKLLPGEYRFKRSDESPDHHWGQLRLAGDGEVILGER